MNKIVSVTNSITSGKEAILEEAMAGVNVSCCFLSGPTKNVSVLEITSLQTAMKLVNASDHLSTENFFKTLLMYNKPNQGWLFSTTRDPQFLAGAIKKNRYSDCRGDVSEETQREIALAMREGRLGAPMSEDVAFAIVDNIDKFTDEVLKSHIYGYMFDNAHVLESPDVQRRIAANFYCYKREDFTMGEKLAQYLDKNLHKFTDKVAQQNIVFAFQYGNDGRLANHRIPDSSALALVAYLGVSTDPEVQRIIAKAICDGRFGKPISPKVTLAIFSNLHKFTDKVAQKNIAMAIDKGILKGRIPDSDALALFAYLDDSTDPEVQRIIAKAIRDGRFGNPISRKVTLDIFSNLDDSTDPEVQRIIAKAIYDGRFGDPSMSEAVAHAIAKNLDKFTDTPKAQESIVNAICGDKFPYPSEAFVLAIADNLDKFTHPDALLTLSEAIRDGKFGDPIPKAVAIAIFSQLVSKFNAATDPNVKQNIDEAIHNWTLVVPTMYSLPPEMQGEIVSFLSLPPNGGPKF